MLFWYRYDTETGLYYLQSRYYNPEWGRFINADTVDVVTASLSSLTDKNLFSYCDNNPVIRKDENGYFWNIVIGATFGALVSSAISLGSQLIESGGNFNAVQWKRVGAAAVAGAISGGLAATGILVGGQMLANGVIGAVSSVADTWLDKGNNMTLRDAASSAFIGGTIGVAAGFIGGNGTGSKHLSSSAKRLAKNVLKKGKPLGKAISYYSSQTTTEAIKCGKNAIFPILKSSIPGGTYSLVNAYY